MDKNLNRKQRYTSEKIKYYRRLNSLTQADMAEKLWMSERTYHRLENGETALTLDRIHQLSEIFDVSITQLIGEEPEKRNTEVIREFRELSEKYVLNEKMIIEILKELKNRIQ